MIFLVVCKTLHVITSLSTSNRVLFYYIGILMMTFLTFLRRFPTTFRRFPKIFPKLFQRPDKHFRLNIFRRLPKMTEEDPKMTEEDPKMVRSYTNKFKLKGQKQNVIKNNIFTCEDIISSHVRKKSGSYYSIFARFSVKWSLGGVRKKLNF